MKKQVFCKGCANLFVFPGKSGEGLSPRCLATAVYEHGPLRDRIDITGTVQAEERNLHNDCPYFTRFSLRARSMKGFILGRLEYDGDRRLREGNLKNYAFEKEQRLKRKRLEEESESLRFDGGIDGFDESDSSSEVGFEDVSDS